MAKAKSKPQPKSAYNVGKWPSIDSQRTLRKPDRFVACRQSRHQQRSGDGNGSGVGLLDGAQAKVGAQPGGDWVGRRGFFVFG